MSINRTDWVFSIQVVDTKSSKGIQGLIVEIWDKDYANNKNGNDLLCISSTDLNGKCLGSTNKSLFQDISLRHFDNKLPDVYFVIKDLLGNILLVSDVKTNLKAGFHAFILRIDPQPHTLVLPAKPTSPNWTIMGELLHQSQGQRFIVECYDKDTYNHHGEDDRLFVITADLKGKFEHTFYAWNFSYKPGEKELNPDLYFVIKTLQGKILYTSDVFSNITANTVCYATINLTTSSASMAALLKTYSTINWTGRIKSSKLIRFPIAYNSFTKFLNINSVRFVQPRLSKLNISWPFLLPRTLKYNTFNSWEFEVKVLDSTSGKPIPGLIIESWDKDFSSHKPMNDLLWSDTSDINGAGAGICKTYDFQNKKIRHLDAYKPDVFFVVRDLQGNLLHCTKIFTNLDKGYHQYTLKIDTDPLSINRRKSSLYWDIQGEIKAIPQSFPIIVECYDKDYSRLYGLDNLLFAETIYSNAYFRQIVQKWQFNQRQKEKEYKPDIFFVFRDMKGQILFSTRVFSNLKRSGKGDGYRFGIDLISGKTTLKTIPVSAPTGASTLPAPQNQPPSISITPPTGALIQGENIEIKYNLSDPEADIAHIETLFSLDGGITFLPASESLHPASEGTTGLISSQSGIIHTFIWKTKDDLPGIPTKDVQFRIKSFDKNKGGMDTTQPFTVGAPASNHPPRIKILEPQANTDQGAVVEIKYELLDDDADSINIKASFSDDGGLTFTPATKACGYGSEGISDLNSSSNGKTHSFFWNAINDLPILPVKDIILQIESFDKGLGGVDTAGPFEVIDNFPPMIQVFSPMPGSQQGAPVEFQYVLTDKEADTCRLDAFFSLDRGLTFLKATPDQSGDGIDKLVSSEYGEVKSYLWDAASDLLNLLQTPSHKDVMFKIQAFDMHAGGIELVQPFDVTIPIAPKIQLHTPSSGIWGMPLPVIYTLSHPAGVQQLKAEIAYSTDKGLTFSPASEAQNTDSEGLTDLSSTPAGEKHYFAWDAFKDLAAQVVDDVILRIRAYKNAEMGEVRSDFLTLDSGFLGIPPSLSIGTGMIDRPQIKVMDPPDHEGIHVEMRYLLKHAENKRANVRVEYSLNGGAYDPARIAKGSDQLTNLPAPHLNASYCFIWDANKDMKKKKLTTANATLRATPYIGANDGTPYVTKSFKVDIAEPEQLKLPTPNAALNTLSLEKITGDDQYVLAGQLPAEDIVVELLDSAKKPVRGVRISFLVRDDSQVKADIEAHPELRTTSDYYGRAGIRIRPEAEKRGDLYVLAQVVGMPSLKAIFTLKSAIAKIEPASNNPTGPFLYGEVYPFYFFIDTGDDYDEIDFYKEAYNPLQFKVSTHNAEASHHIVRLPGSEGYLNEKNAIQVNVTPSIVPAATASTNYFTLNVESLNMKGVVAYISKKFSIDSGPPNASHLVGVRVHDNGYGAAESVYLDYRIFMGVESGYDPEDVTLQMSQCAYPGLTLDTPFKVKITNGTEAYNQSVNDADEGDCARQGLKISELKVKWLALNGVLSTSKTKGTKSNLELTPDKKVYFTPTHNGPWSVTASYIGYIYDPQSEERKYARKENTSPSNPSGSHVLRWYCRYKPGFDVALSRVFYIHMPEYGFEDLREEKPLKLGPALAQVKPAMNTRLYVKGISPFVGTPDDIELKTTLLNGDDLPKYKGVSMKYKQDIKLHKDKDIKRLLRSDDIFICQNEEKIPAGISHAMIPLSWIQAGIYNLKFHIKTAGLKRERQNIKVGNTGSAKIQSLYESPVGTSPAGGYADTITLHNGELVYDNPDIEFPSRIGELSISRTYRSQLTSLLDPDNELGATEPLGPGWFLDVCQYLEVNHKHLRLWDGTGMYFDYPYKYVGKGQFLFITNHDEISDLQSAWEIKDRNANVYHFNPDGTLRFFINRHGHKYTYHYNELAQLIKIKDCMHADHRYLEMVYHKDTETNRKNKCVGRIALIKDFKQRTVNYEYYEHNAQNASPGSLKKVIFPECKTYIEGTDNPKEKYRKYEQYEYVKDSIIGFALGTVKSKNSKDVEHAVFTNHYAQGRIFKQEQGSGHYLINVKSAQRIEYLDKNGHTTLISYKESPYWDATTPTEITDPEMHSTKSNYNHDGFLTLLTPPKGGTVAYIYNEESPYERSRADLLAIIKTSSKGKKRISTYAYSSKYHLIKQMTGPEGNIPGKDPKDPVLHTFFSNYDYQRGLKELGNVVDTHGPRDLHMIFKTLPDGKRQPTWIDENPETSMTYNEHGLITSKIDEMGIKTDYYYFPSNSPTSGTPDADGGGLLGEIRIDTELTDSRKKHYPDDDAKPQPRIIKYGYNDLGYQTEEMYWDGTKRKFILNQLGEIITTIEGEGISGLNIVSESNFGPNGEVIAEKTNWPAGGGNGAEELLKKYTYLNDGNVEELNIRTNGQKTVKQKFSYDKGDRLIESNNLNTSEKRSYSYDKRDLETESIIQSGGVNLKTKTQYNENGKVKEITDPAGDKVVYESNDFDEIVKTKKPDGTVSETILNEAGDPSVHLTLPNQGASTTEGGVGSIEEIPIGNFGPRRYHKLWFAQHAGSHTAGPYKPPEYLGLDDSSYLQHIGSIIQGSGLGPNDGRSTQDAVYDAEGKIIRYVDDALGEQYDRYDAYGRSLESDDKHGMRINTIYNDQNHTAETSFDPKLPDKHIFTLKAQYDKAQRITSQTDELGNAFTFAYDAASKPTKVTNPEGTTIIQGYNARGIVSETEIPIKVSGQHPEAEACISTFNSNKVSLNTNVFDERDRMVSAKDAAGNEYVYHYENNLLKEVIYPAAKSTNNQSTKDVLSYDSFGRLESIARSSGDISRFFYAHGQIHRVEVKNGSIKISDRVFEYDEEGRITNVTDQQNPDENLSYAYDSLGNMIKETSMVHGQQVSLEMKHDGAGRVIQIGTTTNDKIEYSYDPKTGNLLKIKDKDGELASYEYTGQILTKENYGGIQTEYQYQKGKLSAELIHGLGTDKIDHAYKYDKMGRVIEETVSHDGKETKKKYVYDTKGRLLIEETILPNQILQQGLINKYYYDADDIILKEERDEFDSGSGQITRVTIVWERDALGVLTGHKETKKTIGSLPPAGNIT